MWIQPSCTKVVPAPYLVLCFHAGLGLISPESSKEELAGVKLIAFTYGHLCSVLLRKIEGVAVIVP
jgi:hypothetical protein